MPKTDEEVSLLKVFTFHGLDISGRSGDEENVARCPFCGRDGKLYIDSNTGQWDCKTCDAKGNVHSFLKRLWEDSLLKKCDYSSLSDRGFLHSQSMEEWGLCRSILTDEWILPGFVIDRQTGKPKFKQLYVWREDKESKRKRFICRGYKHPDEQHPTNHALYMWGWSQRKDKVLICEGLWDGVALKETLSRTVRNDDEYSSTGDPKASLLSEYNIVAVPGANVFYDSWVEMFSGKEVSILFDNDHSRKHPKSGKLIEGSGLLGVKRVTEVLTSSYQRPSSIEYLKWGQEEQWTPDLPTRYDIRDHLTKDADTIGKRVVRLGELFGKLSPVSDEWIAGKQKGKKGLGATPIACATWKEVKAAWEDAMFWNPGLDAALPAMIATAAMVPLPEDLVWLKVMSPPSTGKTELAEALALNEEAVTIVSTFTGLHSGVRSDDGSDYSLISMIGGKCLIVKEGDTLLRLPDRERVWSELRDAYDRNTRTHFKNGVSNQYLEHPFGHILCGTESLHDMDDSELGQRYLNVNIMRRIDPKMESAINRHKLGKLFATLSSNPVVNGQGSSTPEKLKAKQLTAGYLEHLRSNIESIIMEVASNSPPEVILQCDKYASFISYFRARPSSQQSEEATKELSVRLATQLGKMAVGIGGVLGERGVTSEVMSRVRKITLDTAHGVTLDIAKLLYEAGDEGLPTSVVASSMLRGETEMRELLRYLKKIEVTDHFKLNGKIGIGTQSRWRLTKVVRSLYKYVMGV